MQAIEAGEDSFLYFKEVRTKGNQLFFTSTGATKSNAGWISSRLSKFINKSVLYGGQGHGFFDNGKGMRTYFRKKTRFCFDW